MIVSQDLPVVVSGMQLTIAYHHTSTSSSTEGGSEPNLLLQGAKVVLFQILLDGAEPRDAGMT